MSNLERTGVTLVAENSNQYLNALNSARQATVNFNQGVGGLGTAMQTITPLSMAMSVAVGGVLAGAFVSAASAVVSFSTSAIDSASKLQDVRLNIESLTAAELLNSGAAETMNEAIEKTGPVADYIMETLKKLSLASPFEYQQILGVYQMNKAFGQSTEMSLELTKAITNLGAANKSIPGIMERVSYNFSQMALTGQITARDMRDLAMAGVDLGKMFRDQLGMSVEEVNEKLKSGQMTFEEVSKAFAGYVDKYFGTAAERASKTFSGLKSSFNDLAFFSSVDIFGGALDVVTKNLSALFDKTQEFIQAGGLKPIGAGLEVLTEQLFGLVQTGAEVAQNFYNEFGAPIMQAANDAFSWGGNIVGQLAAGIIEGIATTLAVAMDAVSAYLSFWLAPGSPPRVAPEIDTWGTAAMTQFLKGFGEADFDVLKKSGSAIQSALSALVGAGAIDQGAQLGIFQSLSGQLAGVLSGAGDPAAMLASVRSSLGAYGAQVAELINTQLALGDALERVKAAEESLKKLREAEEQANQDVIDAANEYNELAKAGASPAVLAAKRAEFEAAKKRREEAKKGRKEAEDELEQAQEKTDELKKQAELQAELVRQLIELTKQVKEKEEKEKKLGGAGTPAGAPAVPGMPDLSQMKNPVENAMESLKETIRQKLQDAFKPLTDAFEKARRIVEPAWKRFTKVIGEAWDELLRVTKPLRDWLAQVIPPEFITNLGFAAGVVLAVAAGIAILIGIGTLLAPVFAAILSPVGLLIAGIILLIAVFKTWGPAAWQTVVMVYEIIKYYLGEAWEAVKKFFGDLVETWKNNWDNLKKIAAALWGKIKDAVTEAIAGVVGEITSRMDALDPEWRAKWEALKTALAEKWREMVTTVKNKLTEIKTIAGVLWAAIVLTVKSKVAEVLTAVKNKMAEVKTEWSNALGKIITAIGEKFNAIREKMGELIETARQVIADRLAGFAELGRKLVQSIIDGIAAAKNAFFSFIAKMVLDALDWALDQIGGGGGGGGGGDDPNCFVAGTRVNTPGGYRAIETLQAGETVLILSAAGLVETTIEYTVAGRRSDLVAVAVSGGRAFHVSPNHLFKTVAGWRRAEHLEPGVALVGLGTAQVKAVTPYPGEYAIYNLHVAHPEHTYLVEGVVVHNRKVDVVSSSTAADASAARMALAASASAGANNSTAYNLTLNTRMEPNTVQQGFDYFRLLGG
jgi:tape measure domain-containing protein